jgi:hypothetical protein
LIGLIGLYGGVFIVLVMIQFTKQGHFNQQIGNLIVRGQYRTLENREPVAGVNGESNNYPLADGASVFFGGIEFSMHQFHELSGRKASDSVMTGNNDESLILIDTGGRMFEVVPEYMTISGETAGFYLPDGTEVLFSTQYIGGTPELRISGNFADTAAGISLPYKPLKTSRIRNGEDDQFIVIADGLNYIFSHSEQDTQPELNAEASVLADEPRRLFLQAGAAISYRAIPEKKAFSPADFIIPAAKSVQTYNEALIRWRDQNFSLWNRVVPLQTDEDMIIAYEGEAIRRGNYKAAVSAVPAAFLGGAQRTYESSVYLGGMGLAVRSFAVQERGKITRLSRQISEKSLDFLRESHVFEFFAIRGYTNFIDDGVALVHTLDPAALTLELTVGVLEGVVDLRQYRPNGDNPFERLVDQSCFVISESIHRSEAGQVSAGSGQAAAGSQRPRGNPASPGTAAASGKDLVLVFQGSTADIEFNLRLGKALLTWAEASGNEDWSSLGRSLILSCLSLEDSFGNVPQGMILSGSGEFSEGGAPRTNSARLYRILQPGEYYPQAMSIIGGGNGIWAWTAAQAVSVAQSGNVLDISVTFPVGEAHHMMIRGVRPFTKIQLYGIDYRTDSQFERYDSSGWVYQAQDQILVLKMKHRAAVEHIRIFYSNEQEIPRGAASQIPVLQPVSPTPQTPASQPISTPQSIPPASQSSAPPPVPQFISSALNIPGEINGE